jgi:hypothetical protein
MAASRSDPHAAFLFMTVRLRACRQGGTPRRLVDRNVIEEKSA